MNDIVKIEISNLIQQGNIVQAVELSTWIGTTLALVRDTKITDMTLALAASAGLAVWRAVAEEYVTQLIEETKFSKAAAYLISLGEVKKAVKVQLDGRLYRDALILAKLNQLEPEIIDEILSKWAERAAMGGNLAQAAKVLNLNIFVLYIFISCFSVT